MSSAHHRRILSVVSTDCGFRSFDVQLGQGLQCSYLAALLCREPDGRKQDVADADDSARKRDEEQVVRDDDADTRDTEQAEKADEEQAVRDTDADTKNIDSRLDAMEEMMQRMNGTLTKLVSSQSALVGNGVIYDVDDTDPSDDDNVGTAKSSVLDLSIDDID